MSGGAASEPARDAARTPLELVSLEDSADDAELIVLELTRNGLDPTLRQVQTRDEMERALRERRWDAICLDFMLPRFDAFGALELRNELAAETPVIIVSGYIGETAAVSLLQAGADDYVPKNNLARLAPALRRAMRACQDRRARRQAEEDRARLVKQLASALELRDDFLILASHELRTPLTALRLQLESAARAGGPQDAFRSRLAKADRQIDRISGLIEDMLTVSKLRPPAPLRIERLDLGRLIAVAAASFAEVEKLANIAVRVSPEPLNACVDRTQMEDALRRLLKNAAKYGVGAPIEVCVARSGTAILVSVSDHGIGIAPEHHARIFERFGRAEVTLNYGGLGLGLWIVRQGVEAQGGTVTVASQLGEGATFTISIPAAG